MTAPRATPGARPADGQVNGAPNANQNVHWDGHYVIDSAKEAAQRRPTSEQRDVKIHPFDRYQTSDSIVDAQSRLPNSGDLLALE